MTGPIAGNAFRPPRNHMSLENCVRSRAFARIRSGEPLPPHLRGAIVALGNFDGFHLGHQEVAARAFELARARGVAAIIGTFDPHPVRHFRPGGAPFRLTTLDQRQRLFTAAGIDAMMVFAFDDTLARATPKEFIDHWLRDAGGIVTGENFHFGAGRSGDIETLAGLGARRGLTCAAVGPISLGGEIASSSRIRDALRLGDCAEAGRLLTRPFAVEAVLRPGRRLDPALGMLDASAALGTYLRPRPGVYAVRARLSNGRALGGSAYLAEAPDTALLELFLVDLSESDLGQRVEVELIAHLHDARETYDLAALRGRIEHDRMEARALVAPLLH